MSLRIVDATKIKYDLKKACADCPFRVDAKFHNGIFQDLESLVYGLEKGDTLHTCHKTDPRSDCPTGQKHKGPMQHCGGLLSIMAKNPDTIGRPQMAAWLKKQWNRYAQDVSDETFANIKAMVNRYVEMAKDELEKKS